MEFWNLLMDECDDNSNKINKLNNLGADISNKVEEIEIKFQKLRKINKNNYEILFCYSEFLKNILNKNDIADKYKEEFDKAFSLQNSEKDSNFQNEPYAEFKDINDILSSISKTDTYQYVIVSVNPSSFGIIQNISLGMCINLGYTRSELIGKHLDIIIPEIMHKEHKKIMLSKANE